MTEMTADHILDARGLLCPMPVVRAGREMKALEPGQVMKIMATDRGAIADFPAWAEDTGNELVEWHDDGEFLIFMIRKGEEDQ
jgi:TusA-related sulfurtransferase